MKELFEWDLFNARYFGSSFGSEPVDSKVEK